MMRLYLNLIRCLKDERGVIAMISAIVISCILLTLLALSIGQNANLVHRADIDQKLHLITKHAAKEYAWYVLRKECEINAIPDSERFLIDDASQLEEKTIEQLKQFIRDTLVKSFAATESASVAETLSIPEISIRTNESGRKLFYVRATLPQHCWFNSKECGDINIESTTALPFGGVAHPDAMVLEYVMGLNVNSLQNLADKNALGKLVTGLEACAHKADMADFGVIRAGAVINNPFNPLCLHGESPATLIKIGLNEIAKKIKPMETPRTAMVYLGSCPDDTISYSEACHLGNVSLMNWENPSSSEEQIPSLETVEKEIPFSADANITTAEEAMNTARRQLDHVWAITDGQCPEFRYGASSAPSTICNLECDLNDSDQSLCIGEILCRFAMLDIREVGGF